MEYVCPQTCIPEPCPSLATEEGRKRCWANFLNAVLLKDAPPETPGMTVDAAADMYQPVTIYFKPSCELIEAAAGSGGVVSGCWRKFRSWSGRGENDRDFNRQAEHKES